MCIICLEIMNERMTLTEARRALFELIYTSDEVDEHTEEMYNAVLQDLMKDEK